MSAAAYFRIHALLLADALRGAVLVAPLAILVGCACALFLWLLDAATNLRFAHPELLFGLPLAGALIAWLYERYGGSAARGNNLIIDEIHEPGAGVPLRMAPLILATTVLTHLCGGSAGREGTAIQMAGGLAGDYVRRIGFLIRPNDVSLILTAGIAAGFAGVFGTPLAGAVFALEVLAVGRIRYDALGPCLVAAIIGDWSCAIWGGHHTHYHVASLVASGVDLRFDGVLLVKAALVGAACGGVSVLFVTLTHGIQDAFKRSIANPLLRPVVGGLLLIALAFALDARSYLGLGVTSPHPEDVTIVSCFHPGGATLASWWWKLLFTALTLGAGFKGGEVTPLFFIGAALGNAGGSLLGGPIDLFAAIGFVAVFAGATNTPLACTIMAIELFGAEFAVHYAVACIAAYTLSGHNGIYTSQRICVGKSAVL
ncbi:MAG TPA: chloride channel protein, partial [Pirellulales bacterium]